MVYTRSTASRSTAPTRGKPPVENHEVEPESSDEDDEGIPRQPAVFTPRRSGVVTLRPPKRPRDDELPPSDRSKRQRTSIQPPNLRGGRLRLASDSSQTEPRAVIRKKALHESPSPDVENEVSDELVKCISSILNPRKTPVQQQTSEESPSDQLLQEEKLQATDYSSFEPGSDSGLEEHSDGLGGIEISCSEVDNLSVKDVTPAPGDGLIAVNKDLSVAPNTSISTDKTARLSPTSLKSPSSQPDPYEIPISPPPTIHLDEPSGLFVKVPRPGEKPPTDRRAQEIPPFLPARVPRLSPDNVLSHIHTPLENGEAQARASKHLVKKVAHVEVDLGAESKEGPSGIHRTAVAVEENTDNYDDILDNPRGAAKDHEVDEYSEISDSEDDSRYYRDDIKSPSIDGINSDVCNGSDIDLSVEESLSRDIMLFKTRHVPEEELLSGFFSSPPENDFITVHIRLDVLKEAMNLMKLKPWCGLRPTGLVQTLDAAMAETLPGQHIMPLLAKLRRVYLATPRAPLLKEQNMFLSEHSDMITYYFSKIDTLIDHIRTKRLERSEHNPSTTNQNEVKRSEMAGEIMTLIIPMILQVLVSARKLGGDQEDNAQFTRSTVEFLRKGFGWITRLYHRASRQLLKDGEPLAWNEVNDSKAKRQNRRQLVTLLDQMVNRVDAAIEMLLAKELEMKKQQTLRLQREKEMQLEEDRRERQRKAKEQNRRAFLSIEGKSVHSTASPSPSSETTSTNYQLPLSAQQWSWEEKYFLFQQLSQSYPNLPDLAGFVRQELNRDLDDIKSMSRNILRAMLEEACEEVSPGMSAAQIEAEIENIFRSSGV